MYADTYMCSLVLWLPSFNKLGSLETRLINVYYSYTHTRLAEVHSNPHLLAKIDHFNRTSMQDDVKDLMQG